MNLFHFYRIWDDQVLFKKQAHHQKSEKKLGWVCEKPLSGKTLSLLGKRKTFSLPVCMQMCVSFAFPPSLYRETPALRTNEQGTCGQSLDKAMRRRVKKGCRPRAGALRCDGRQKRSPNHGLGERVRASTPSERHRPGTPEPTASGDPPNRRRASSGSPFHS